MTAKKTAAKDTAEKAAPKEAAASTNDRLDALEKEVKNLRALMQRNGWSC